MSRFYVPPQEARRAHAGLRMDKFMNIDDPEWPDVAGQKLDDAVYRLAYQRWETFWKTDPPEGRVCVKGRVKGRMAVPIVVTLDENEVARYAIERFEVVG